jgi:Ran GTPase-activating protein (RanGAP) involved in mRNA processing and transport
MYDQFKDSARVTLNDKFIGDQGCSKLAEFIASHRRIESLEIKSNDIGPAGFQMIFRALA